MLFWLTPVLLLSEENSKLKTLHILVEERKLSMWEYNLAEYKSPTSEQLNSKNLWIWYI